MDDESYDPESGELTPRDPSLEDVVSLCRELNAREVRYVVVGGFAIRAAGYSRHTKDVDLIVDAAVENEARVFDALATLPDGCVRELEPGDVAKYLVVRVADEILVDLMATASGIDYAEAAKSVVIRELDGVAIPFASPELLWRMKIRANREKDRGDIQFLRMWFAAQGRTPPEE
jgi:hypothetical protein